MSRIFQAMLLAILAGPVAAVAGNSGSDAAGPGFEAASKRPLPVNVVQVSDPGKVNLAPGAKYPHGHVLLQNLKSRFAIMLFWEDAVGDKIGILDLGEAELPGPWRKSMDTRFWTGPWSEDAIFGSWSPDGTQMLIESGEIYGDCGIYLLNLLGRTAEKVGSVCDIASKEWRHVSSVDWDKMVVTVQGETRTWTIEMHPKDGRQ